jgi:hypothetical protein
MVVILLLVLVPAAPTQTQSPTHLPVSRLTKPPVNANTTQQLGGLLDGIGGNAEARQDEFRGKNRFFRLNEQNRTVLTQCLPNMKHQEVSLPTILMVLGLETPAGSINPETAKHLACLFLINNSFVDSNGILSGNEQSNYPVRVAAAPGTCDSTKDFGRATLIRPAQASVSGASLGEVTESVVGDEYAEILLM